MVLVVLKCMRKVGELLLLLLGLVLWLVRELNVVWVEHLLMAMVIHGCDGSIWKGVSVTRASIHGKRWAMPSRSEFRRSESRKVRSV